MKYFYDCEFLDTGLTIDLVSIGIVASDGREYYAQCSEFKYSNASQWVIDNVFSHLPACPYTSTFEARSLEHTIKYGLKMHKYGQCIPTMNEPERHRCDWRTRYQIQQEILQFMDIEKYGKPELLGYYSAYDHVVFCQLFGTMMNLPNGFPMYTFDIKQLCDELGNPTLPEQEDSEHHALTDARHNKVMYDFLMNYKKSSM